MMAKAYIENFGESDWTLDEYERFMVGTGEWRSDEIESGGRMLRLPSGCYYIPEQYTRPDENGAVV
jgi:hypothetical protein